MVSLPPFLDAVYEHTLQVLCVSATPKAAVLALTFVHFQMLAGTSSSHPAHERA
jgi:hypothetical protein